jgi:hypothetical protein
MGGTEMKIQGTNICMIRGDTEAINVSCRDESGADVPFVEGDIVYFTVKRVTYTEEKTLQKIVTEFIDGAALITIFPNDTQELKTGVYYYDIQLNRANGQVKTIIPPSQFVINEEVTYE